MKDWREGCERCKEILRYGGMGHTMSIHSRNEQVILEFGLKKPAFRIVVNTPTTHGSVGMTTGLDPAMTLGCGGWGGNITSDNISPKHLLNIKRLAYELRPAVGSSAGVSSEPKSPRLNTGQGLNPAVLSTRIDQFLASRGIAPSDDVARPAAVVPAGGKAAEFVCEEDVRRAVRAGQKIVVDSRTIVTPAARDLGDEKQVFIESR